MNAYGRQGGTGTLTAKGGARFKHGDVSRDVLDGCPVSFLRVSHACHGHYLGTAIWFYRHLADGFPALLLVWPDKGNRLPWDVGFDPDCKARQPLLGPPPASLGVSPEHR